ncbi:hypothetical protein LOD99_10730 [Oopsacas minuta]|uniref:Uncharacterized protein n=1 Tax=Oopsacas minuta TaxID=111878 RepID=A0AAV7KDJ2_9METZ|nr:hypothetical protein LOD99_10730 [Oopsacas minuta]
MFDYRLSFPFIEVLLIQTDVITDPLQTQLRVIINNSTFSITTINLLPQHNIPIPTFSDDTYYIHVSHNHQVGSRVFMLVVVLKIQYSQIDSDPGSIYLYTELSDTHPLYIPSLVARLFYITNSPVFVEVTTTLYIIVQEIISNIVQPSLSLSYFNPIVTYPNNVWSINGMFEFIGDTFNLELLRFPNEPNQIQVSLGNVEVSIDSAPDWTVFSKADTSTVLLCGVNDVILNSSFTTSTDLIGHFVLEQTQGVTHASATLTTDIKLLTNTVGVISDGIGYADLSTLMLYLELLLYL